MRLRPSARLALLWGALLLGCGSKGEPPRTLYELERMTFVPAAPRCRLRGLHDCSIPDALLVDRFEFTRSEWEHYRGSARPLSALVSDAARSVPGRGDWPAYLTHRDALGIAEARGLRLLSAREWIHVAVGPRAKAYPNGQRNLQASVANTLELGLGRPAPVGTFEGGRSVDFGCYDLIGNVWEWVADWAPSVYMLPEDTLLGRSGVPDGVVSAMGGSYLTQPRPVFDSLTELGGQLVFNAISLDGEHLTPTVGARFCVEADRYLTEHSGDWSSFRGARERLTKIGRGWGRSALPLLRVLAAEQGAAPALAWLKEGAEGAVL